MTTPFQKYIEHLRSRKSACPHINFLANAALLECTGKWFDLTAELNVYSQRYEVIGTKLRATYGDGRREYEYVDLGYVYLDTYDWSRTYRTLLDIVGKVKIKKMYATEIKEWMPTFPLHPEIK